MVFESAGKIIYGYCIILIKIKPINYFNSDSMLTCVYSE